jgi:hypothetical protein
MVKATTREKSLGTVKSFQPGNYGFIVNEVRTARLIRRNGPPPN